MLLNRQISESVRRWAAAKLAEFERLRELLAEQR
jgi:hypothetical protein